jgi:hypothetical protein
MRCHSAHAAKRAFMASCPAVAVRSRVTPRDIRERAFYIDRHYASIAPAPPIAYVSLRLAHRHPALRAHFFLAHALSVRGVKPNSLQSSSSTSPNSQMPSLHRQGRREGGKEDLCLSARSSLPAVG